MIIADTASTIRLSNTYARISSPYEDISVCVNLYEDEISTYAPLIMQTHPKKGYKPVFLIILTAPLFINWISSSRISMIHIYVGFRAFFLTFSPVQRFSANLKSLRYAYAVIP